jgi:hypothetical protein
MQVRHSARPAAVVAGLGLALIGFTAPAVATTAHPATTVTPTVTRASAAGIPSPDAPHSGKIVTGVITGAAARKADPPVSAARRFAQLNAASKSSAAASKAGTPAATSGADAPAATSAVQPDTLTSWSGAFHGYWGTFPSQTIYGAQATQSLNPNVTLGSSSPDLVYSPTLDPSGIDCIEVSTIYSASGDQVGAWDWCASSPGFDEVVDVNTSFLDSYGTTVNGQHFYTVQDVQTDPTTNSWTAYLYNYSTGEWDTFYTSANTDKLSNSGGGWDMNEVYTNYDSTTGEGDYCTPTAGANFESTGLEYQLSSGGAWTAATTSNSSMNIAYPRGSDLGCADSGYALPTADSTWQVTNTTHAADPILGAGSGKCVDTPDSDFANGTLEDIYTCNATSAQSWTYNSSGELSVDGGKYCLNALGYGTTDGTRIQLWACTGTTNELWSFSLNGSIVGIGSGLCLNVIGYGTTNGTGLQLWQCLDTSNDVWSWSS